MDEKLLEEFHNEFLDKLLRSGCDQKLALLLKSYVDARFDIIHKELDKKENLQERRKSS